MKKIIIAFSILLASLFITSCGNDENIDNNVDSIETTENVENQPVKDDISKKEPINNTPTNIREQNKNVLSNIEKEMNAEKKEQETKREKVINRVKIVLAEYFNAVNKDDSIMEYLDFDSITTIKNNTKVVYEKLSTSEQQDFLKELQEYGYDEKTFNPDNKGQINKYINFVVKSGLKAEGNIEEVIYDEIDLDSNDEYIIVQVTLTYGKSTKKELVLALNKNLKINISN